jgi:D-sedoheptulose 7-phosphate isomerase
MTALFQEYHARLSQTLLQTDWNQAQLLAEQLDEARTERRQVYFCGNGGSAANAIHWVNDMIFGAAKSGRGGVRAHALPANTAVATCLANDLSYEEVFSAQLKVLGAANDILVVLSGSGNSPNILRAIETARQMGIRSWAIVGFDGGKAIGTADHALHFPIHDMQVAEDCQMVAGHIVTGYLARE